MSNRNLKISFVIAWIAFIFCTMTYETGIRNWAIIGNCISGLYLLLFTYANRNSKWLKEGK